MGDDVRVTIIATGYSVSDIPGINAIPVEITRPAEQVEENKPAQPETLEDAMDRFYPAEETPATETSEESDTQDSTESTENTDTTETPQAPAKPNVVKSDVMDYIDFDDDDALADAEDQPAWMRNRR